MCIVGLRERSQHPFAQRSRASASPDRRPARRQLLRGRLLLRGGRAEAIEAVAHGDEKSSRVIGRGVRDIPLPPGTGIGAILRNGAVLIAHKDTIIQPEDHVILFMVDKKHIPEVERLFQVDVTFV